MRPEELLDLHVAEIMNRWPATIPVFIRRRMHCVGCPIGSFHTLVDAADEHGIALDALVADIAAAIAGTLAAVDASRAAPSFGSPGRALPGI